MTLNVSSASAPTNRPVMALIYGRGGSHKTSFCNRAENMLTLVFDHRGHARSMGQSGDVVAVEKFADVAKITAEDLKNYDVVLIDTLNRAIESAAQHVMEQSPKNKRGADLSIQGWGILKKLCTGWLSNIADHADLLMTCQDTIVKVGDSEMAAPSIMGGTKEWVYAEADLIGWSRAVGENEVQITFGQSPLCVSKDAANLGHVMSIADVNEVLAKTKEAILERVVGAEEKVEAIRVLAPLIEDAESLEELNSMVESAISNDVALLVWDQLRAKGKELGFHWDGESKRWKDAEGHANAA